jgi:hypothetical protein
MVEIAFNELGRKRQGIHQNASHAVLGQGEAKRQAAEGNPLLPFTIAVRNRLLGFASRGL